MRGMYNAGLNNEERLSQLRLALLVFFAFLTGVGSRAGTICAINSTAKSFPDRSVSSFTLLSLVLAEERCSAQWLLE